MSSDFNLVHLPDLVLYHISTFIICPFDLLSFGSTCTRLRKITLSQNLWWNLSFYWFKGVWVYLQKTSLNLKPRDWFLEIIRSYSTISTSTKMICTFSNGELWQRVDSKKLRFLFALIRLAYFRTKDNHPGVLFEQWLYDIGLYKRKNSCTNYADDDLELSDSTIIELSNLGQAFERDLRLRKQPFKNPKSYVTRVSSSKSAWMSDLFPASLHGSTCPLLMCPLQESLTNETSGLDGLSMCISVVLENYLKDKCHTSNLSLNCLTDIIQSFQTLFTSLFLRVQPSLEAKLGKLSIKNIVLLIVKENLLELSDFKSVLDLYNLSVEAESVFIDLAQFLKSFESIDHAVDKIRFQLRSALCSEIEKNLFPDGFKCAVSRMNLTDSDLIGGDNSRQEMSAAAFISSSGVLVTWHLTGRMRF